MPIPRTLVIGSTRHQHVTSIRWEDVGSVNILDFDIVVANMRSLTDQFLKQSMTLRDLRKKLARLLVTNGKIIVIGDLPRTVKLKNDYVSNYSWSPLGIGVTVEAGDSVEIVDATKFPKYMAYLKSWDFYYFLPGNSLTGELIDVCGPPGLVNYQANTILYAKNRYSRMLAGFYLYKYGDRQFGEPESLGDFILLP
jgi:hypothetical protein